MEASLRPVGALRARIALSHALIALSVLAILTGAALRFTDLGTKTVWGDETYTLLRVSGYDQRDVNRLVDGRAHAIGDVRAFQRVEPRHGIAATSNSLAVDEPQHPPLYFAIERLWMGAFGDSAAAVRTTAAFASVAALPAMFWLATELFGVGSARWVAVALFAVSPFQIVYAHEAREYSSWTAITLVATAALLRAARTRKAAWWAVYALAAAAGAYTDLLFVYVIAADAIALLCIPATRTRATLLSFAVSAGAALLAFAPWLVTVYQHRRVLSNDMSWATNAMPLTAYVAKILFNASTQFFDLTFLDLRLAPVGLLVLAVVAAALLVVVRCGSAPLRAIVFALLATAVPFFAGDALRHTYFATGSRYFVPAWIALQLAVAFACGEYAERAELRQAWRAAWRTAFVGLVLCGVVSDVVGVQQPVWWDNHDDAHSRPMAEAIDAAAAPPLLLLRPQNIPKLLVLSRYLRDDARFEIADRDTGSSDLRPSSALFALAPNTYLRRAVLRSTGCSLQPVPLATADTPADRLHAALAHYRGGTVGALWRAAGASCG